MKDEDPDITKNVIKDHGLAEARTKIMSNQHEEVPKGFSKILAHVPGLPTALYNGSEIVSLIQRSSGAHAPTPKRPSREELQSAFTFHEDGPPDPHGLVPQGKKRIKIEFKGLGLDGGEPQPLQAKKVKKEKKEKKEKKAKKEKKSKKEKK